MLDRQLGRPLDLETRSLFLAKHFADIRGLGVIPQNTRTRLRELEGDDEGGDSRDGERSQHWQQLAPTCGTQEPSDGGSENKAEIGRHRHPAEVGTSLLFTRYIGQVSVGHRNIATGQSVDGASEKDDPQWQRQYKAANKAAVNRDTRF